MLSGQCVPEMKRSFRKIFRPVSPEGRKAKFHLIFSSKSYILCISSHEQGAFMEVQVKESGNSQGFRL